MPGVVTAFLMMIIGLIAGGCVGWFARGRRARSEKEAVTAGWKEQVDAQRSEHRRLLDQNQDLMLEVSQHRASQNDATNRARELSSVLKEALARRDELQREIKNIRSHLEAAVSERRQLETDYRNLSASGDSRSSALREKDDKIFRMSRELESWQNRLPPLLARYRERDDEATRLARDLEDANERIVALQDMLDAEQTRIETAQGMSDGSDASNDTLVPIGHGVDFDPGAVNGSAAGDGVGDRPDREQSGGELSVNGRANDNGRLHDDAPRGANGAGDGAGFPEPRDDLKAIKGVGPAIERTLNELGIYNYGQIARMSEYEINRVADRLKGFRTRIYREDWIGQARALQYARPGDSG